LAILRVFAAFVVKPARQIHHEDREDREESRNTFHESKNPLLLERILVRSPGSARILHPACGELETQSPAPRDAPRDDLRVLRVSAVRFFGCGYAALCSSVVPFAVSFILLVSAMAARQNPLKPRKPASDTK